MSHEIACQGDIRLCDDLVSWRTSTPGEAQTRNANGSRAKVTCCVRRRNDCFGPLASVRVPECLIVDLGAATFGSLLELVTPSGQVLGIDRDAAQVEAATRRVKELGLTHVRFETADLSSPPDGPFDAMVGRLVLMYQPDVEEVLRILVDRLVSGGVMAFMEYDLNPPDDPIMWPRSPFVEQLVHWVDAALGDYWKSDADGDALAVAVAVGWLGAAASV